MADLQTLLEWRTAPEKAVRLFKSCSLEEIKLAQETQEYSRLGELGKYLKSLNPIGEAGKYMQWFPGKALGVIPNSPGVLSSMLVGGLTGAGLGYGAGAAAETLQPETWRKKRTRYTAAMLGGLLGATPGLMWGATNVMGKRPFFDNSVGTPLAGELPTGPIPSNPSFLNDTFDYRKSACYQKSAAVLDKLGWESMTNGFTPVPPIDVNQFNDMIWQDPDVAGRLSMPQQAAASGLMTGAANLPGKSSPRLVTPMDMGRMAVGMGSGYASGAVVGKLLGLALGMPADSQERFRQTGMMAGLIANALPLIY